MSHTTLSKKITSRVLVALIVAVGVSACGFHLRGNIPLPEGIQNMFVVAPDGTFKEQLEEVLVGAGAQLAANKAGADVVLNITQASSDREVGTLDERGKADSYDLRFRVRYSLDDPDGKQIRSNRLNEARRYDFDPELVVESESEEASLLADMEESIALRVVRQLSTVTDYPPVP